MYAIFPLPDLGIFENMGPLPWRIFGVIGTFVLFAFFLVRRHKRGGFSLWNYFKSKRRKLTNEEKKERKLDKKLRKISKKEKKLTKIEGKLFKKSSHLGKIEFERCRKCYYYLTMNKRLYKAITDYQRGPVYGDKLNQDAWNEKQPAMKTTISQYMHNKHKFEDELSELEKLFKKELELLKIGYRTYITEENLSKKVDVIEKREEWLEKNEEKEVDNLTQVAEERTGAAEKTEKLMTEQDEKTLKQLKRIKEKQDPAEKKIGIIEEKWIKQINHIILPKIDDIKNNAQRFAFDRARFVIIDLEHSIFNKDKDLELLRNYDKVMMVYEKNKEKLLVYKDKVMSVIKGTEKQEEEIIKNEEHRQKQDEEMEKQKMKR